MSTGGIVLLTCITAVFVVFAVVLAWGASQTRDIK